MTSPPLTWSGTSYTPVRAGPPEGPHGGAIIVLIVCLLVLPNGLSPASMEEACAVVGRSPLIRVKGSGLMVDEMVCEVV